MEINLGSRRTLWIIGLCGLAGILVDIDHVIALFIWRYINPSISEGRIWHTPLFIISCISICYLVSRPRGLYTKLVLVGVIIITVLVLIFSSEVIWRLNG